MVTTTAAIICNNNNKIVVQGLSSFSRRIRPSTSTRVTSSGFVVPAIPKRRRSTPLSFVPCYSYRSFFYNCHQTPTNKPRQQFQSTTLFSTTTTSSPPLAFNNQNDTTTTTTTSGTSTSDSTYHYDKDSYKTMNPWEETNAIDRSTLLSITREKRKNTKSNKNRFRQHVNPLASRWQQPTVLSANWPYDAYDDMNKPLYVDIGCGKGTFLLDLHNNNDDDNSEGDGGLINVNEYNFLGLEIRPSVAQCAKERLYRKQNEQQNLDEGNEYKKNLDYLGCNVNVDLERILSLYVDAKITTSDDSSSTSDGNNNTNNKIQFVSIQFPDPHFKSSHEKRRVVTDNLIQTLAKFLETNGNGKIFLQSDIQNVLDDMRLRFRNSTFGKLYFTDDIDDTNEYIVENPLQVQTEREISVINQNLPVYRSMFTRNKKEYIEKWNE